MVNEQLFVFPSSDDEPTLRRENNDNVDLFKLFYYRASIALAT